MFSCFSGLTGSHEWRWFEFTPSFIMGIPLLVVAFPPLLVLYPPSYALFILRTVLKRPLKGARLLSARAHALVDPTQPHAVADASYAEAVAASPLVQRVGTDGALSHCEDVLVWAPARVAIFSSDPSRPHFDPFKNKGSAESIPDGQLVLYDLDSRETRKLDIENWPTGRTFHPLGVGLREVAAVEGGGHEAILAVANIGKTFAAVEVLRLKLDDAKVSEGKEGAVPNGAEAGDQGETGEANAAPVSASTSSASVSSLGRITATFVHSLENPALKVPNAVLPLSEESVLVTNSFGISPRNHSVLAELELLLAVPLGSCLHLSRGGYISRAEDAHADTVVPHLALANGIALSPDGRLLLVAGCTSNDVHVYDVSPPAGPEGFEAKHARFRETLPVGMAIDNLRFYAATPETYTFLGAGHPAAMAYIAAAASKGQKRGPSQAVTITVATKDAYKPSILGGLTSWFSALFSRVDPRVKTVFEDDGNLVSASATAVGFAGADGRAEMLICGLWDERGALHCVDVDI